jgi:hypothetical protein
LNFDALPVISSDHFAHAIKSSLLSSNFVNCGLLVKQLQTSGNEVPASIMHDIARAYAVSSLQKSYHPSTTTAKSYPEAQSRALKAVAIVGGLGSVHESSVPLLALTSRACGYAGLFAEARQQMKRLHQSLISRVASQPSPSWTQSNSFLVTEEFVLPSLHRHLMKSCAVHGNVTAALQVCDDIQRFSRMFMEKKEKNAGKTEATSPLLLPAYHSYGLDTALSMGLPEWSSLIEAASRSGHWKVCLSTLQFIRPYVERLNPTLASDESTSKQYNRISKCLTTSSKCFAVRSQYAWAVRAIEDWIQWSGRRPPLAAVLETIRALCDRGRDKEVVRLVETSLLPPSTSATDDRSYEAALHVSAVTSLSKEGMYAAADEVFLAGITRQSLPFSLVKSLVDGEPCVTLDLHHMNRAVARSSVRIALQKHMIESHEGCDMIVVTGRGLRSTTRMRPVLRPTVQRLLVEEFCE